MTFDQWYNANKKEYGLPNEVALFKESHVYKKFEFYEAYWNTLGIDVQISMTVGYRIKYMLELANQPKLNDIDWVDIDFLTEDEIEKFNEGHRQVLEWVKTNKIYLIKLVTFFGTREELLNEAIMDTFGVINANDLN